MEDIEAQESEIKREEEYKVEVAKELNYLLDSDVFKKIFMEGYVNNFALTTMHNIASTKPESRDRYMEAMLARSAFLQYIEDILEQGRQAQEYLNEF